MYSSFYDRQTKVGVYFSPKCGSTTIRTIWSVIHDANEDFDWFSCQHAFDPIPTDIPFEDGDVLMYAVVRHPFNRCVSMYTHACIQNSPILANFEDEMGKNVPKTFSNFVQFLKKVKENGWKISKGGYVDFHLYPQYFRACLDHSSIDFKTVKIIKLENNILDEITELYSEHDSGLGRRLKKLVMMNRNDMVLNSRQREEKRSHEKGELLVVDTDYTKNDFNTVFPSVDEFWTKEIEEMVYDVYKQDYSVFNYVCRERTPQ